MGLSGQKARAWKVKRRLRRPPTKKLSLDKLEDQAVKRSLDLKEAKQDLATLAHQFGMTRLASIVPDLEAGVAAERDEGNWDVGPTVQLQIPIFDWGQAKRAHGRSLIERAQNGYRALEVKVRSRVRRTVTRLEKARKTVQTYRKEILPLTRTILDQTLRQYNAMQFGVLQLLRAKQQQILAGKQYIDSLHEYWSARAEVESLLAGKMPHETESNATMPTEFSTNANQGGH